LWLDWTWDVDGRLSALHAELFLPTLDDIELDGDDAGNLDGAAEGDLAVTLREVQVTDRELGALHVDWQVDLAAPAQILDIACLELGADYTRDDEAYNSRHAQVGQE
jgi:hypothetical protein